MNTYKQLKRMPPDDVATAEELVRLYLDLDLD